YRGNYLLSPYADYPCSLIIDCFGKKGTDIVEHLLYGPGTYYIIVVSLHGLENGPDLLRGFAGTVYYFRVPCPQLPVMVNACKSQVCIGKVTKLHHRLFNTHLPGPDFLQYLFKL